MTDWRRILEYPSLGPILSPRVDQARATYPLQRSRGQHGIVVAAKAFEQPFGASGLVRGLSGFALGVIAAVALNGLVLRIFIGGLVWLTVYWAVPTAWAGVAALDFGSVQRDQAREYARALEGNLHDYAEWARRREIAEDFRREMLEFARFVFEGSWRQSATELNEQWRGTAIGTQTQLRNYGATDDVTSEIDRQLAALDAAMETKEDGYGDDDIRRIASSMQATCQNVWSSVRAQPPPTPPTPPQPESGGRAFQ
jgi:hypothetical protein